MTTFAYAIYQCITMNISSILDAMAKICVIF